MPSIHTPPMRTTGGPPWGLPRSFWKTGNMSLHDVRRDYSGDVLPQDLTSFDPWEFFTSWLETAIAADEVEPNAMLLATIGSDGRPRSRVVLLKETSCNGLVFFTHYISPKGEQLAANPVASATFWWPQLMRQVRAVGAVTKLTRQENETYFAKRPRNSQLGAWASRQSAPIVSRDDLLEAASQAAERFEGKDVPCPPEWGGYRIDVDEFEFWQGQSGRLHDRVLARRDVDGWSAIHIQP